MSTPIAQDDAYLIAITTSSGVAHVAATAKDGAVLFEFTIREYNMQSLTLLPRLQAELHQHSLAPAQCTALVADVGPGGFTSLRTACGVVQGLATAWGVPVVPVRRFECLAAQAQASRVPLDQGVQCFLDARLGELYVASLRLGEQGTEWLSPPALLPIEQAWRGALGPGAPGLPMVMAEQVADLLPAPWPPGTWVGQPNAVALAGLGWQAVRAGKTTSPLNCQPLYVRDKVAQTTAERVAEKNGRV
ncbi:tRNA (adenosine(37)-N6)-threonylcarbamoyltransferase complex dimerization subunit type 1 TsaB [Limnobacter sp.]|uniref:tRNA (adenosine(37)-N6)-threonylcarbamoyltransferase complex dimerization subunit type 1 TsaB n=1 Tax=Limnobacter sp. TaxID=2003368 RepID=UPI003516E7E4